MQNEKLDDQKDHDISVNKVVEPDRIERVPCLWRDEVAVIGKNPPEHEAYEKRNRKGQTGEDVILHSSYQRSVLDQNFI